MADAMDVDNTKTSTPKDFPDGQQSDAVKQKHVLLVTADGGVTKQLILAAPEGADKPEQGDEVLVHYVGYLMDGTVFDTSLKSKQPLRFFLGQGKVIKGWDLGIATMHKGEKAYLKCAPEYAYGKEGSKPLIGPDATLVFEVELVNVISKNDITIKLDGGIIKKVLRESSSKSTPYHNWACTFHYKVTYQGKEVFNTETAGEPAQLTIGQKHAHPAGIERLLNTTKVGEKAQVTLSAEYAYGAEGKPEWGIPANASGVVIEVDLLNGVQLTDLIFEKPGQIMKQVLVQGDGYDRPTDFTTNTIELTATIKGQAEPFLKIDASTPMRIEEGEWPECVDLLVISMVKNEVAELTCSMNEYGYGHEGNAQRGIAPNTTVKVVCKLLEVEKTKEWWTFTHDERLVQGLIYKEQGNKFFKEAQYRRAIKKYKNAIQYFKSEHGFQPDQWKKGLQIALPCYLNYSASSLKLGEPKLAREQANEALKIDRGSVKAYFRRAQANHADRLLEDAKADILKAIELEPGNKDLKDFLHKLNEDIRKYDSKDKKVYSKMFS